jgi:branched-chain amino acid aminotransferase
MSMEDQDGMIWLDGALVPWRAATAHVLSHTLHHGVGVFEGVRAYRTPGGTAAFRLQDHTDRFFRSAHILQMALPLTREELTAAQLEAVRANGLDEAYIRPIAWYGGDRMGVSAQGNRVHVAVAAWRWDAYLGEGAQSNGIALRTSSFRRHDANSVTAKAKASGLYINSVLAVQEAKQAGADDALMLDTAGHVAEASTSNIFAVTGGRLATPGREAILEGITRASVMTLAADLGLPVAEERLTRDALYVADEIFMTGTASEITPVTALDGRVIGVGIPGPVTRAIQAAYADAACGRAPRYANWLTAV